MVQTSKLFQEKSISSLLFIKQGIVIMELFDSNALSSIPEISLQNRMKEVKIKQYLKASKCLSTEIKFHFLIGQIDKLRRRPKYHLFN